MRFDPFQLIPVRSAVLPILLCDQIRTPTILPRVEGTTALPLVWIKGEQHLSSANSSKKIEGALCDFQVQDEAADKSVAHLFRVAHQFLTVGDLAMADRCLQKALALQSRVHSQVESNSPATSWLVLATCSLIKKDFDSCETWLRQAERSLHTLTTDVDSNSFQQSAGDLLAMQACLFAQTQHWQKAEKLLLEAFRCHMQAGNFEAAVRDLILKARVLMLSRKWQEADSLLQDAIRLSGKLSAGPEIVDPSSATSTLLNVINHELSVVHNYKQSIRIAQSN